MRDNPIHPTVDFERDGVQHGFLKVPYSGDDSGWGAVMVPITVIKKRRRTNSFAHRRQSRR